MGYILAVTRDANSSHLSPIFESLRDKTGTNINWLERYTRDDALKVIEDHRRWLTLLQLRLFKMP
jgi:hypothetical protein